MTLDSEVRPTGMLCVVLAALSLRTAFCPTDPTLLVAALRAVFNSQPGTDLATEVQSAVESQIGRDGLVDARAVLSVLTHEKHIEVNRCQSYHLRKALARPLPGTPVVTRTGVATITIAAAPYHPFFEVRATVLEVDVNGTVTSVQLTMEPPGQLVAGLPVQHIAVDALELGKEYCIRVRWCTPAYPLSEPLMRWSECASIRQD